MAISQVPISTDSFTHKVTNRPRGRTSLTWYMVATEDRFRSIWTRERMMAKRAKAKTVEVEGEPCCVHVSPKGNSQAYRRGCHFCGCHACRRLNPPRTIVGLRRSRPTTSVEARMNVV